MHTQPQPEVAVLLATYNGARFIEAQLRSLKDNATTFTLHWVDDRSSDGTRDAVRMLSRTLAIPLREWHVREHLGVPLTFFHLLTHVEAEVYLFCDQDDIWQTGKIDATVANLLPNLKRPALCYSDPLVFRDDEPGRCYRMLDILGTTAQVAMQESRIFTPVVGFGHTEGFTRPLRDIFVSHQEIARTHAFMHDMWLYAIAVASGPTHLLSNAPTTLYRQHSCNASGNLGAWQGGGIGHITATAQQYLDLRRQLSRHARGFILASKTIPYTSKLERILKTARLVAELDRRHSLAALIRLARHGVLWPNCRLAFGLVSSCLLADARDRP